MNKKLSIIIRSILLAILVAVETWTVFCLVRLQMMPPVLTAVLIGGLVLVAAGVGLMLFVHCRAKKISLARKITAYILMAVVMLGCVVVIKVTTEFYHTMSQITNPDQEGSVRSVYVMADDPARTIHGAAAYTFGVVSGYDEDCTQQVVEALQAELKTSIKTKPYENVMVLIDGLYDGEVGAIILNEGYLSILEDDTRFADFSERTRLLYAVPVDESGNRECMDMEQKPLPSITNTPFIIYLSGMDTAAGITSVSRSDVNILMAVNPVTKQVLMVNTPRDYYVVHPYGSGARDKLTHCGIYGIDCSIEALENLYGVDVSGYARINFTGFETMIDAIGGITIYSDRAYSADKYTFMQAGENYLNGKEALAYARDRYHQPGGDNDRGKNQMKVVRAVIEKISSGTTLVSSYSQILSSLEGMFATSITMEDMGKLVRMQLSDMAKWEVFTYAVTGFGDTKVTYSMPGTGAYVMHPNEETVKHAGNLMQKLLDGQTLSESDMQLPE